METSQDPLIILDAIAPFMQDMERHRVNWSKIDFAALETSGYLDSGRVRDATDALRRYCARAKADGATALAFDDLPHLYLHATYPETLLKKLEAYRDWYREIFAITREVGLDVYVNADIQFYHPVLEAEVGEQPRDVAVFLRGVCEDVLRDFPEIEGMFFRLGECDGQDVQGDFHSKLVIQTPGDANHLLRTLLPVFAGRKKQLILRTWTVGAYAIGDLMWNPKTLDAVIEGMDSPYFALSMKYGESDFFRYLRTNPQFFHTPVRKLVELQTKREYEGCGEYPSFVGYDYETVLRDLEAAENMIGIHVWCQSGGWTSFRRLTYVDKAAVWNEINTFVTMRMCRDRIGVEEAVAAWVAAYLPAAPIEDVVELLRLSDEVIKELLYIEAYATQRIYFRRLRIPPQIMVYWDHIFVNHALRKVMRCFVDDVAEEVRNSQQSLQKILTMRTLTVRCGLPEDDISFMHDTFAILAAAREYALLPFKETRTENLAALKMEYKRKYRHRYRYAVKYDFGKLRLRRARLHWLMNILMRRERTYRRLDKIFVVWLLGLLYPMLRLGGRRFLTGFAGKQAMGLGTIFR